jgi:hypothetical protein
MYAELLWMEIWYLKTKQNMLLKSAAVKAVVKVWTGFQLFRIGSYIVSINDNYNGYQVSFLGVKWPGSGTDHTPPTSAEVKELVELYLYSPSELYL